MTNRNKQVRTNFVTPAFRVSYPALFEPRPVLGNEGKLKYSVTMLFPKITLANSLKSLNHLAATWMPFDNLKGLYQEICKVARGNFGPEVALETLKLPKFRDGDKPKDSGTIDENEKGYIIVRTSSQNKPDCVRQDKTRIADPSELYPGCWARALITIAPFVKPSRGVTVYLQGIQKLADDVSFSSRPRVEDEFDAVAVETDANDVFAGEESGDKDPWEM